MAVRCVVLSLFLSVCACAGGAYAQTSGDDLRDDGLRRDTLVAQPTSPYVIAPLVLPGSETVRLDGRTLSPDEYRLDYRKGELWLLAPVSGPESRLIVTYRTLPFTLKDVYRRRSITRLDRSDSTGAVAVVREERRRADTSDPFAGLRLQRSGSITRGILAGNNRDATVESGLRLQLSGEIVEGVNIQAVLSDKNTPILPEGTTQRLNEFDKVFIEIEARQGTAQLGDFDLAFRGSEFARLSRKLQGVSVSGKLPAFTGAFGGGSVTAAGATARGIFRSQDVPPLDGIQGPYRLEGQNGERFIIVVPGSEVVYLDGRRLTRGETNDYTIDYATGEVTFSPRNLITSDRRITVEFQYTTNQFTRTLVGSNVDLSLWPRRDGAARARLGATFIREADSRQFEEEFGFTSEDSMRVARAGDGPATSSGAERVVFDPEATFVQYVREARAGPDGSVDTVFVALDGAPPDTVAVYRVRFTRVGAGNGRYVRVGRSVNGILYEYRGPGLGEYEPVRLLPKPKQQRLFDLRGAFEPIRGVEVYGEWANSLNDLNRLSNLDAEDDVDDAYLAGVRLQPTPLLFGDRDFGKISASFRRRVTGAFFVSFDRTRPVEFGRKWNLLTRPVDATGGARDSGDERVDEGEIVYDPTPQSSLRGEWGRITLGDTFTGVRRALTLRSEERRLPHADVTVEYIDSRDARAGEGGTWLRSRGNVRKPLLGGRLVPRFEVEQERREQSALGTDSLTASSFAFVELRPGIAWKTGRTEIGVALERRTEQLWAEGALRDAAAATTLQTTLNFRPSASFSTNANLGFRVRRFKEFFRVNQKRENTESVVLRWNTDARPFHRAVRLNWLYDAQTERTPILQEIYVRTGPELGQFVWEDDNGNGVIEVDEFIPERVPDEGTYVRTFIPSDSLTSVISVQARVRLELDPARLFGKDAEGWKKWLSHVATRTILEVQEKSREPDLKQIYLLNLRRFRDPLNTLNGRLRIGQDVYLFRSSTRYGLDVSFTQVRGLTELSAGEETRFLNVWRVEGRYRPATRWNFRLTTSRERNRVVSEAFASRRYDITRVTVEPKVSFQPSRAVRISGGFALARNDDALGDRRADVLRIPFEGRYNFVQRFQITARFEAARVTLDGAASGLAQFELTDGRGPGTSFLWGFNGQYALNRFLRASFSYDGRAPSEAPVLHTVRMQLSAVF